MQLSTFGVKGRNADCTTTRSSLLRSVLMRANGLTRTGHRAMSNLGFCCSVDMARLWENAVVAERKRELCALKTTTPQSRNTLYIYCHDNYVLHLDLKGNLPNAIGGIVRFLHTISHMYIKIEWDWKSRGPLVPDGVKVGTSNGKYDLLNDFFFSNSKNKRTFGKDRDVNYLSLLNYDLIDGFDDKVFLPDKRLIRQSFKRYTVLPSVAGSYGHRMTWLHNLILPAMKSYFGTKAIITHCCDMEGGNHHENVINDPSTYFNRGTKRNLHEAFERNTSPTGAHWHSAKGYHEALYASSKFLSLRFILYLVFGERKSKASWKVNDDKISAIKKGEEEEAKAKKKKEKEEARVARRKELAAEKAVRDQKKAEKKAEKAAKKMAAEEEAWASVGKGAGTKRGRKRQIVHVDAENSSDEDRDSGDVDREIDELDGEGDERVVEKSMDDLLVATETEENVLGLEDDHEDPTKEQVLVELSTLTLSLQASFEDAESDTEREVLKEELEKLGSKIDEAFLIHGLKVADMDGYQGR
ncbi:hypothetical protein TrCOL_g8326 [Triparma columacea]|uniref:Uncharacterized protein n=1 Tax=Triparma columacea TaxID=722753 RepID=A0A9W7G385_9STRA|nr:hypothetical protein TrCOL_g8326 [Triparma columacea]